MTFLINHSLAHYYHWSAELLFGLRRNYSSLDVSIASEDSNINTLPPPHRMLSSRLDSARWRDYANTNQFVLRMAFHFITMNSSNDTPRLAYP
ncbi:hypothetical protein PQX77_020067 [Marasmius sp. AFHP31]|nr:hypothetical protein PQX77_020067 [Marasmius sp. AFHP31]